ncbi:hypothetical protein N0V95_003644 [Ascochyta clinopodiicola]|nr:hypothetical protein N0V95_003644 [Ascochyta clinopodiicola]
MYQLPLCMSVYKMLAILHLELDDARINLALNNELEASHLCNSGPCYNPKHIMLETGTKNMIRKGHQECRFPCDCEQPCLRNGVVWYPGEEPGVRTYPAVRAGIGGRAFTEAHLEKFDRENRRVREKDALEQDSGPVVVPRPHKLDTALKMMNDARAQMSFNTFNTFNTFTDTTSSTPTNASPSPFVGGQLSPPINGHRHPFTLHTVF